jgi:hypothetical protein
MKEQLFHLVQDSADHLQGRNISREYLQALVLKCLQRSGAMVLLAFKGGTALRFLHNSRRYSQDLEFALQGGLANFEFQKFLRDIQSDLRDQGYALEIKMSDAEPIKEAFVSFPGLLYDLQLSHDPGDDFSIKIDIDTDPPPGAGLEITLIRKHVLLRLFHYDRATLFAEKMSEILGRVDLKGRDMYDLVWYLCDPAWPAPNLALLNNALGTGGWNDAPVRADTWVNVLEEHLASVYWENVVEDVRPYLEPGDDILPLLNRETLKRLLERAANRI